MIMIGEECSIVNMTSRNISGKNNKNCYYSIKVAQHIILNISPRNRLSMITGDRFVIMLRVKRGSTTLDVTENIYKVTSNVLLPHLCPRN